MLASVYLVRAKKPAHYTLIPAVFMIITCEAALVWEAWVFVRALIGPVGYYAQAGSLVEVMAVAGNALPAILLTWTFLGIAVVLCFLDCAIVLFACFQVDHVSVIGDAPEPLCKKAVDV